MTDAPLSSQKAAKMSLKSGEASGREVLIVERLAKSYGERILFENLSFTIERGERVGVVGPNGAGKSTLIKLLIGREEATFGMVRLGHNVSTGYFAQDVADLDLDRSVLENMLDMGGLTAEEARTFLGRFLFTGEDVFRTVRSMSGGEKNKLSLAQITYMRPNLLILDEPTNHLDLVSREALGAMLSGYDGALILVSHDRHLLGQVTQRTIEVSDGHAAVYDVGYAEYRQMAHRGGAGGLGAMQHGGTAGARSGSAGPTGRATNNGSGSSDLDRLRAMNAHQISKERQRAKLRLDEAEKSVAALEAELAEIIAGLSRPSSEAVDLARKHGEVLVQLEEAIAAWESAATYADLATGI
jgi:ATP-binding cassette subfamily F protein 3